MPEFVEWAGRSGALVTITDTLDACLEVAQVAARHDGRPVLFERVKGQAMRIVTGICSSRAYFAQALNLPQNGVLPALVDAAANPQCPPIVDNGTCQEVVETGPDLGHLPVLTHLPGDGGPYITSGVMVIRDPDYGRNISFHRLMVTGPRTATVRVVEGRGTHTAWSKQAADLPVAVCIGASPAVLLAASMSPPKGVDELSIAHKLAPTPLVRCKTLDLHVPAECEIVLEGRLTHRLAAEGPFLDLTETRDVVRQQPVLEIDCITHRAGAIYHALLPGMLEHKLLMGVPREPTIYAAVNEVCACKNVLITPGGTSWLHAVVQIEKRGPQDGLRAIEAAFRGHGSLKHVVVVDDDVDIYEPAEVEWAIATRFQADKGLVVRSDQPGSSLDPSSTHVPGKKTRTAKMGLDATIPWGVRREDFERVRYWRGA
ncbi:MAG: UbiD family decarboxylase [Thermoflexales bacterium]|nr:UbiD family decarboxylase [Thermoflexales bacterium]